MKKLLTLFIVFCLHSTFAQINDDFSDNDFTNNPIWIGTTSDYIVNAGQELQVNNTVAGTSNISTPHNLSTLDNIEWHLLVRQTFSPSTSNYGRVYLTSSTPTITAATEGFYLQFGEAGATDAVRLMKIIGGISTEICAGTAGQIANSFGVGVRVVRSAAGLWTLSIDPTGGTNYTGSFQGTDVVNLVGTHFGFQAVYTASNANKFYYDNIYVGPEILDVLPPSLVSVTAINTNQIDVLFNEAVAGASLLLTSNYVINPLQTISGVMLDGTNAGLLHISLSSNLVNGQINSLSVLTIADLVGNTTTNLTSNFQYLVGEVAVKGDLIINEIMTDPSPVLANLPEVEFIEIYNKSTKFIDLTGWKLGDLSTDGTVTSGFISPGQYKLLIATGSATDYPNGITVTSFPSINNTSETVYLKNPAGQVMDKVAFTDDWYQSEGKKDGGYSFELINPNDPCSDQSNWIGSFSQFGGTPSAVNSVYSISPDVLAPQLLAINAIGLNEVEVLFSEKVDSVSLANAVVTVLPNLSVLNWSISEKYVSEATITFTQNLVASQLYEMTLVNVQDCWLNSVNLTSKFALADTALAGDLIINEILFDPATGGYDFVELFNTSTKVLNLKDVIIANFDNDTISNPKQFTSNYTLFPNDYVVFTQDSIYIKNTFPATVSGKFASLSLPSLDNDSSTIYVIQYSKVLDKVSYLEDWQFQLLDATENKTLERIDPKGTSNVKENWRTAAESIGFGTPGRVNSQFQNVSVNGDFGTTEAYFSPDSDGDKDVLVFYYSMEEAALLGNLVIYDDAGRQVKKLFSNELLAVKGTYTWDGTTDETLKAPVGIYIAVFEANSLDGKNGFKKKIALTLSGKIN